MTDLTGSELFKDLASFKLDDEIIDLHNSYNCIDIVFDAVVNELKIVFEHISEAGNKVGLVFENVSIRKMSIKLNRTPDSQTLNILYRGRFEVNNVLYEYSSLQQSYFYFEFEEGDAFEVFSDKVFALKLE